MSYSDAVAGLKTRAATVSALRTVINGQPSTAHNLPLGYIEADTGTRQNTPDLTTNIYRIRLSVLTEFQDNVLAEDQIGPFINSIPAALDQDPTLGGAVVRAMITDWVADYLVIGEKTTRRVTFIVDVKDQGNRGGTI